MQEDELQRILDFVETFTAANGFPPSYGEIAEGCRLGSVGHVQYRINRLAREGRVARTPGRARSLVVLPRTVDEPPTHGREHNGIKRWVAALFKGLAAVRRGGGGGRK